MPFMGSIEQQWERMLRNASQNFSNHAFLGII